MPSTQALNDLADMYLSLCSELYKPLVKRGILPSNNRAAKEEFIRLFTAAFEAGSYSPPESKTVAAVKGNALAIAYVRYSDDSSNPRSLAQQLRNIMLAASREGYVILPVGVFADAAVSARTTQRTGYKMARSAILEEAAYRCLFIDELGRANRDVVDALQLGRIIVYRGKRLVGVTDYLDSSSPHWEQTLQFAANQNEHFVKQLRDKVNRGMTDSFQRGGVMGQPPMGLKIVPVRDANGEIVIRRNGKVQTQLVIDEQMAPVIRQIFELYAYQKLSPAAIAQGLNSGSIVLDPMPEKQDWSFTTIVQILKNRKYKGEHTWKKTQGQINPETQRSERKRRPKDDWMVVQREDLRIVSDELWEATERRRADVSRDTSGKGIRKTRTEAYPRMPFLLFCDHCKQPLYMNRSGISASVCCPRGREKRNGCGLASSKTIRVIEECITARLRHLFLEEIDFACMLADANRYIANEAKKPKPSLARLDKDIKNLGDRISKIKAKIATAEDGVLDNLIDVVADLEKERQCKIAERDAAKRSTDALKPINAQEFQAIVDDLRDLLNDDVRLSASVLAKVCGRIYCRQGEKASKGHKWIARMEYDSVPLMVEIGRKQGLPTTNSLEYLLGRSWNNRRSVVLELDFISVEQRIAEKARELRDKGACLEVIARALQVDSTTIKAALNLEEKDIIRYLTPRDTTYRRKLQRSKSESIRPEVVRLYDEEGLSFAAISRRLKVSLATAQRSYHGHFRAYTLQLVESGKTTERRAPKRLPAAVYKLIIKRLQARMQANGAGPSDRAIAREAGVSKCVVHKARKAMERERGG